MPFRFRIVLWFSLAVLVVLVIVRLVTVAVVRIAIYDALDSSLKAEAVWMQNILYTYKAREVPETEIYDEIQQRSSLNPRKEFITVRDPAGNLIFKTANLGNDVLPNVDSLTGPVTVESFRDVSIRLICERDARYSIAIGYPLTDADYAIGKIVSSSNFVFPLAIILVFAGGLFLAGRFVAPIKEVNRYLAAATGPLSRSLPELDATRRDEIGELSRRVRGTVSKMRGSMRWILSYSSLVPHQLRTPVTVIRSQLENSMQEPSTRAQLQAVIASTYDEILKLNDTIENLLTLGKLQAGTLRLQMQKLRVRNFLEGFRDEARALAACKEIEFVLEEGPDVLLTADMEWIRQSLFNLLDNAIRHTPEGGMITARHVLNGPMLDLQLSDTGEGIPEAEIPRLFEPFFQGEYRDQKASGAGLGLVLVKLIASAHHGSVRVASTPGKGTTFTVSLPLKPESEPLAPDGTNE